MTTGLERSLVERAGELVAGYTARAGLPAEAAAWLGTAQAARAAEVAGRLAHGSSILLPDPVGTGKTVVALVAAALLCEQGEITKVIAVAPNSTVADIWAERAQMILPAAQRRSFDAKTRAKFQRPRNPARTLLIVDEAHRGLQGGGAFQEKLVDLAAGCKVLLVTATPFLLSSQGLMSMLDVGATDRDARPAVEAYGHSLNQLARAYRRAVDKGLPDPVEAPYVGAAVQRVNDTSAAARAALDARILPASADLRARRRPAPPLRASQVAVPKEWTLGYSVARIVPDLLDTGKGDMFNRRLVSSSFAFWEGRAGRALKAREESDVVTFAERLRRALGDGAAHPKVAATTRWVAERVREGRNVLVFCVFDATRRNLGDAIAAAVGDDADVEAPSGATISPGASERFCTRSGRPQVLVLQDRFSESIDLDGGRPCLVHHDLPWTPARLDQRWGRVVRARSGFEPVGGQDIFVPVLEVEIDRRMFETVDARARIGDLLLTREVQGLQEDEDRYSLPERLLLRIR